MIDILWYDISVEKVSVSFDKCHYYSQVICWFGLLRLCSFVSFFLQLGILSRLSFTLFNLFLEHFCRKRGKTKCEKLVQPVLFQSDLQLWIDQCVCWWICRIFAVFVFIFFGNFYFSWWLQMREKKMREENKERSFVIDFVICWLTLNRLETTITINRIHNVFFSFLSASLSCRRFQRAYGVLGLAKLN